MKGMKALRGFFSDVKNEFTLKGFLTVIGAFLFSLSIVGLHGMVKSQFILPVSEALGIPRTAAVLWDSAGKLTGIASSALVGTIYKKLGPRGLVLFAASCVSCGYLMLALLVDSIPTLYLSGLLIGAGNALAGGLMFFTLVKPWWNKAFGTFSAICGTASGVGGVLFVNSVTKTIESGGIRAGALKVAALTLGISLLSIPLMNESPNDVLRKQEREEREARGRGGKAARKKKEKDRPADAQNGIPALGYGDFLREPLTWLLFLMMFMSVYNVPSTLFSPIAAWKGYDDPNIVGGAALTAFSFMLIWTKLGAGALRDALGMKYVIPIMYSPALIFIVLNRFATVPPQLYPYVSAVMAFSATSTQLLVGFINVQAWGKYFNVRVQGLVWMVFQSSGLIAGPLQHLPHDLTGSYDITLDVMLVFVLAQIFVGLYCLRLGKKVNERLDKKFGITEASAAKP